MIYTPNWIERLNKDFRRVLFIRSSMPDEDSVITLLGSVAMEKKAYKRKVAISEVIVPPISEDTVPPVSGVIVPR